ncbi:ARM repeat-containing protein [Lichtheimia hyalospora FSU 10163]|nr:ARM repeat-containing protein [Lichtheimia hyalospora FSU 10163]
MCDVLLLGEPFFRMSSSPIFGQLVPIRQICFSRNPLASRQESLQLNERLRDLLVLLKKRSELETCDAAIYGILNDMLVAALLRIKKANARYDSTVEIWLECMLALVSYERWQLLASSQLVQQFVILFSDMIMPPDKTARNNAFQQQQQPEEIQHLAVQCLSSILPVQKGRYHSLSPRPDLIQALQDVSFRSQIGYTVTALLELSLKADAMEMRLVAMDTLKQLLLDNLRDEDIIAFMLPRIVSNLCRIMYQKKEKENHRILVTALDVLGDVLVHVLRDTNTPDYVHPVVHSFQDLVHVGILAKADTISEEKQQQQRTKEWYETIQQRLEEQLQTIIGGGGQHSEWRVRRAYVRFANKLLTQCTQTVNQCVPLLLKTMVLHYDDPYKQVAIECKMLVGELMTNATSPQLTIIPTLQSNLYTSLTSLPACLISGGDEQDKSSAMALITGYILILGKHAESVLDKGITRNADAWLTALTVDRDGLNILDEAWQKSEKYVDLHQEDSATASLVYPKFRFKHLIAEHTVEQATRMLNAIGSKSSDVGYWINFFKGLIHPFDDNEWEPQAIFVIHALLSGAFSRDDNNGDWGLNLSSKEDMEEEQDIKTVALQTLHDMMEIVIDPVEENSLSKSTAMVSTSSSTTTEMQQSKVLSICFGLQTVGLLACILEREYMQDELIAILYPLLAHLGSPNISIHSYALTTLDVIALVCGQRSAKELSVANCDYIINMVTRRMTVLADNMRGPLVLKALVRIGGHAMVDYLGDTVQEIFDALDRFHMHGWLCAQLCSVLTEIVLVFYRSTGLLDIEPFTADDIEATGQVEQHGEYSNSISKEIYEFIKEQQQVHLDDPIDKATTEEIGRYFLERQREKENQQQDKEDDLTMDHDEETTINHDNDNDKIPLTPTEKMTADILQKAQHFLTSPSPNVRSEILALFGNGAAVLQGRPETLVPLVATVWPSIMQRLKSDNEQHHTTIQAVICVGRLAESVGDALSRRFEKQVWPRFHALIQRGQSEGVSPYYSPFSYMSRLQGSIIQAITKVVDHVDLSAEIVPELLAATQRFLDERFHPDLQEYTITLIQSLAKRHADTVWLGLFSLLGDKARISTPDPMLLDDFVVPEWSRNKDKYLVRNARKLLDQIA